MSWSIDNVFAFCDILGWCRRRSRRSEVSSKGLYVLKEPPSLPGLLIVYLCIESNSLIHHLAKPVVWIVLGGGGGDDNKVVIVGRVALRRIV
jgi:hypothetical protein